GSANATSVVLTDPVPVGAHYVAGSTKIDGVPVGDVAGASRLASGLSLGTIAHAAAGDNSRQVTFQVAADTTVCGQSLANRATLAAAGIEAVALGPVVTEVATSELDVPTKAVSFPGGGAPGPGSQVVYTMTLGNSGTHDIGGVRLTDPLPDALVVSSVFATSGTWALGGGVLEVSSIRVPAGGTAQVVVLGRIATVGELAALGVPESAIDGHVITNQATVSGGCGADELTDDPELAGVQATELTLTYVPRLATSTKSVVDLNGGYVEPGDVLRYRIAAVNTGNRAVEVVAYDDAPPGTAYGPGTTRIDAGPALPDVVGVSPLASGLSLGQLQFVGDTDRIVTFDVVVTATTNGTVIANDASLRAPSVPAADVTVSAPSLTVIAAPVVSTSTKVVRDLAAPLGVYEPGEEVEYEITVSNTGNRPATLAAVSDALDATLTYVTASEGGSAAGQFVQWTLGTLAPGETRTLTLRARLASPLDDGTLVRNHAHVTCAELPAFDTPNAEFLVSSAARLVVTKVDEHPAWPARPGDAVTYRIIVRNDGNMTARNLTVTDPLDVALVGASSAGAVTTGQGLVWNPITDPRLLALSPGAANALELTVQATLAATLVPPALVSNQVTVQAAGLPALLSDDPDVAGPADPTTFIVLGWPDFAATSKQVRDLTGSAVVTQPGDTLEYTLVVANGGTGSGDDVVVRDPLPAGLTVMPPPNATLTAGVLRWDATSEPALAQVATGTHVTLVYRATVAAMVQNGTRLANQAQVTSAAVPTPVLSDDPDTVVLDDATAVTVTMDADLGATLKAVTNLAGVPLASAQPGDTVRYHIDVSNRGNAPATSVVVTDPVDTRLVVVAAGGGMLVG
ncbi:MAG: hypothetical protein AAB426_04995, partial [Myxococcota bacterium]